MSLPTRTIARLGARLSGCADILLVNSHAGLAVHRRLGYRTENSVVVPNGFDPEVFAPNAVARRRVREELGLDEAQVLVGMVARVDPMKDYATFQAVAEALPACRFIAVGTGTDALSGPENMQGLGTRSDVADVLNAVDIFLLTSAYGEGMSNAIGEAMATARPVVATDVGDAARMLDGEAGIVVAPRDRAGLAAAVSRLAADPATRRSMGERGRARVTADYSIDRNIERFRRVLGGGAAVDAQEGPGQP